MNFACAILSANSLSPVTYVEYGKVMNEAYRDMVLSVEDPVKRAEVLKPILEFTDSLDNTEIDGAHTLKSVVATMQAAKDQFTNLVSTKVQQRYGNFMNPAGFVVP